MKINLTPEIEKALMDQARDLGTTPELLALDSLRAQFIGSEKVDIENEIYHNLADFLGDYIGSLQSAEHGHNSGRMSKDSGKQFTNGLTKKREQGHL